MRAIRGLALLYALGVVLASPVTLHAEDPQPPPEPAATTPEPAPDPATESAPPAAEPAPAPAPPPQAPAPAAPAPAAPAAAAPAPATEPAAKPAAKAPAPRAVSAASASVTARDFSFSPATVSVNVGDSVTWTSTGDEPHNAVGNGISTPLLDRGESASESFSQAGSFSYVCTVHPQMTGTVKVVASQSDGGGSSGTGSGSAGGAQGSGTDTQQQTQATGPRLPSSGLDAWLLAGIGIVLLAAGIAVRDRLATR